MKILIALAVMVFGTVTAGAQGMDVRGYKTSGHPVEALETADGKYVLVTVAVEHGVSGIDVFRAESGKLKRVAFQPLGTEEAQGILLIPHTRTLAVGLSDAGVAFVSLDETLKGTATPKVLPQGEKSGSGYLAVSPDGQYLFVANEYGEGGNIGVIALHRDDKGMVSPVEVTKIPTPRVTPGVAISADGKRVYTVGEVVRQEMAASMPGHGVKELQRQGCVQGRPDRPMPNGVLYVIDAARAEALTAESDARSAVMAMSAAGCSPVREAMGGERVYVTARGDNRVLIFDAKRLEAGDGFLGAVASGGDAPVGIRVFDAGRAMIVANSNRFAGGSGSLAVFDLSEPAKPLLKETIKTGPFPRNVSASADGKSVYVTVFLGNELLVLRRPDSRSGN